MDAIITDAEILESLCKDPKLLSELMKLSKDL